MKRFLWVLVLVGCERPAAAPAPAPTVAAAPSADACQREIPDCAAACSLRETGRLEHIDWFDRRCAAVILGKNPDKVVGPPDGPVIATPAPTGTTSGAAPAPTGSALTTVRPVGKPPYDPFAAQRRDATDPPECIAARRLTAKGLAREAQALAALCEAKGGDAGAPAIQKGPDGDDPFGSRH